MSTQVAVRELIADRNRIDNERARINKALQALGVSGSGSTSRPPSGPGPKKPQASARPTNTSAGGKRTFKMSDEAKEKIRQAQRARWAKIRKTMGPQKVAANRAA